MALRPEQPGSPLILEFCVELCLLLMRRRGLNDDKRGRADRQIYSRYDDNL